MALRKIHINEYAALLLKLDRMDFTEADRIRLEQEIRTQYRRYQSLLHELQLVQGAFDQAAKEIKGRRFLRKANEISLSI